MLEALGCSFEAELLRAARPLPSDVATPTASFGHPPALIPLYAKDWLHGNPKLVGLWRHWFTPSRRPTYVGWSLETNLFLEVARNPTQLVLAMIGPLDEEGDEDDDEEGEGEGDEEAASAWLGRVGVALSELPGYSLNEHPAFKVDHPIYWLQDGRDESYTGDFPYPGMELTAESVRAYCGHEDTERLHDALQSAGLALPPWLERGAARRQPEVFDALLDAGDLSGAWMALNSPGWTIEQTREALDRLAATAGDPDFRRLADAWIAQDHEENVFGMPMDPRHELDLD